MGEEEEDEDVPDLVENFDEVSRDEAAIKDVNNGGAMVGPDKEDNDEVPDLVQNMEGISMNEAVTEEVNISTVTEDDIAITMNGAATVDISEDEASTEMQDPGTLIPSSSLRSKEET